MEKAIQRVHVLVCHKMTNLETFSMLINPEPEEIIGPLCGCHDTIFSEQFAPTIIKSLPKTCVNLELDTGGVHIGCCCILLRQSLQQLSHLRLRTQSLCWKLLSACEPAAKDDLQKEGRETRPLSNALRSMMVSSVVYPRSNGRVNQLRWRSVDNRWVKNCQNILGHDFGNSYPQLPSYFASLNIASALPNIEH